MSATHGLYTHACKQTHTHTHTQTHTHTYTYTRTDLHKHTRTRTESYKYSCNKVFVYIDIIMGINVYMYVDWPIYESAIVGLSTRLCFPIVGRRQRASNLGVGHTLSS